MMFFILLVYFCGSGAAFYGGCEHVSCGKIQATGVYFA